MLFGKVHSQLILGLLLSKFFAVPDVMLPFTVVACQLPLSSVRLVATLVPMVLIIILPTATPEVKVSL